MEYRAHSDSYIDKQAEAAADQGVGVDAHWPVRRPGQMMIAEVFGAARLTYSGNSVRRRLRGRPS